MISKANEALFLLGGYIKYLQDADIISSAKGMVMQDCLCDLRNTIPGIDETEGREYDSCGTCKHVKLGWNEHIHDFCLRFPPGFGGGPKELVVQREDCCSYFESLSEGEVQKKCNCRSCCYGRKEAK